MKPPTPRASRQSGFTLIEVVIALAIFVVGALAIIRIFPVSLSLVQTSGERTAAMNLSRAVLGEYSNAPLSVPRALYDDPSVAGNWMDPSRPGATVGTANRNQALPHDTAVLPASENFDQSGLGHFKNVDGERYALHQGQAFLLTRFSYEGNVTLYEEGEVKNAKILYNADPTTPALQQGTLDFTGATFTHSGSGVAAKATTNTPASAPPVEYVNDTVYYVTYSYTRNGHTWRVVDEPMTYLSANVSPQLIEAARDSNCVPSQKPTIRYRHLLATVTAPSTDKEICGYVDLSGVTFEEGQEISVNYTARDWRWMVDDSRPVKTGATAFSQVLPIQLLDDTQNPALYSMVWDSPDSGNTPTFSAPAFNKAASAVPLTYSAPLSSPTTTPYCRSVYRTLDNWTTQPSVAADSYLLHEGSPTSASTAAQNEFWRFCALDGTYLYFAPSEAGKTVAVTYSYVDSGKTIRLDGQLVQIGDSTMPPPGSLPTDFSTRYPTVSRLELRGIGGSPISGITSMEAVRGASIQVRTAWMVGDRFQQASVIGYRRDQ